jgi:hypothetical protein
MMNLTAILKKSWQMLWNYRALWLFGAVLALVGPKLTYPGPWLDLENNDQWIKIKINETTTVRVPGDEMTIDFTAPGGVRLITPDFATWQEFNELVDELNREAAISLRPILIEFAVILGVSLLLGLVARYIAETALIRMVDESEETGSRLSLWQGLRRGFSLRAGRLFIIDLVVGVLSAFAFIILFGLAVAPILLALGRNEAVLITVGVGTLGLVVLATYLWLAASAVLSLVMQNIRRAVILEEKGFLASIRQGFMMTRLHLKEVGLVWLVWLGIRIVWIPLGVLVLILLVPVLLLTILTGVALGGVPATVVALIASSFTSDATSVIMGLMAGLPIFVLVMVSPILFVGGLVEVYLSTIWTLAYRDLRAMEHPVPAPAPQSQVLPASGSAD